MATSDEWSRVGFTGNPVTGNPGVVENITKELRDLGDLAGRVDGGLDTLLTKAEDGGFEGRTADALRTYVKDELKTFMANINRSFEMAADATARYARALAESQDRAQNAADTVAALERVGGQPLPENDPEMNRARNEVDAEVDAIQAEAKILEETLREAARLVSRPVKKPKKSFWKRFVSTFFKVLEIVALVVTIVAAIIGGPLGLVAFGLGAVLFAKALVDYATGNGNALSLGLAFLGILFPSTKGLTTLGGLARLGSSGGKALGGALSASGRMLFRGGRMLFSSPGRLLSLAGQGLVRFGSGLGSRAAGGFMALPRFLSKTPAMLGSALRFMGGFARNTFRQGRSALTRDFVQSTAFVGGNMAGRLGVFTVMSLGRLHDDGAAAHEVLRDRPVRLPGRLPHGVHRSRHAFHRAHRRYARQDGLPGPGPHEPDGPQPRRGRASAPVQRHEHRPARRARDPRVQRHPRRTGRYLGDAGDDSPCPRIQFPDRLGHPVCRVASTTWAVGSPPWTPSTRWGCRSAPSPADSGSAC